MKKILILALSAALFCGSVQAQGVKFGVIGGLSTAKTDAKSFKTSTDKHGLGGLAVRIPLAAGFAIQPGLVYHVKGAALDKYKGNQEDMPSSMDTKAGFLEVPIQIQWGPDLLAFRPYVFAEPFIGIGVNAMSKTRGEDVHKIKSFKNACMQQSEYGLGLGAGLEVWKLQLAVRYYWNFGSLYHAKNGDQPSNDVAKTMKAAFHGGKNFDGVAITLAYFF